MPLPSAIELQRKMPPSREKRRSKRAGKQDQQSIAKAPNVASSKPARPFTTPAPRKGQDMSHLLNFRTPERRTDMSNALSYRRRGPRVRYDKDRYMAANYHFVVDGSQNFSLHLAVPDKAIDWDFVREVHLSEESCYQCPICLEPPVAARITQCGHVYCWPCVKRLLSVAGKNYAPCPICTNIITGTLGQLKPAVVHLHEAVSVKSEVTLELMRREKGSMTPLKASSFTADTLGCMNAASEIFPGLTNGCPVSVELADARFSQISSVTNSKRILERERSELLDALQLCHSSQDLEMVPHIESCLRDLDVQMSQGEKSGVEMNIGNTPFPAPNTPTLLSALTNDSLRSPTDSGGMTRSGSFGKRLWVNGELHDVEYSDDDFDPDDDYEYHCEETCDLSVTACDGFGGDEMESAVTDVSTPDDSHEVMEGSLNFSRAESDRVIEGIHFFYQSSEGQKVFLHPVNMRCLLEEYGSYLHLPHNIRANVIEIERFTQNDESRKRYKAFEHLPLGAEMRFVEVEIAPLVSKDTLKRMQPKLQERAKSRKFRAKREAQLQARAEKQKQRDLNKVAPPPEDLLTGPSLLEAMAAAQGHMDDDALCALLMSEEHSPPLPSQMASTFGEITSSSPGSAGPKWTELVRDGPSFRQHQGQMQIDDFPALGEAAFPSLSNSSPKTSTGAWGAKLSTSPPVKDESPNRWSASTPPKNTWGARTPSSIAQAASSARINQAGGEALIFDMDEEDEVTEEERRRRIAEARDRAWEAALAGATHSAEAANKNSQCDADEVSGKESKNGAKKGRKNKTILLSWG
mmetsp:Transcript_19927/g.45407  ORF Transcript_19927/g.45407 Transcript_19927/m.45407 type:complete len:805 (-) Transcript_19927:8-2422(-)|eukprot:571532-Hanusia_phi.AAC.4